MFRPFALEIYRRYRSGESVQQLALNLGIPEERIEQRIRAAAAYLKRNAKAAA